MRHLNDEELQQYLSGDSNRAIIEQHLNQCDLCYNNILAYQFVDEAINETPQVDFSENFDVAIMERVRQAAIKSGILQKSMIYLLTFVWTVVIFGLWYFLPELSYEYLNSFSIDLMRIIEFIDGDISSYSTTMLVLFSSLVIGFYQLLEGIIFRKL